MAIAFLSIVRFYWFGSTAGAGFKIQQLHSSMEADQQSAQDAEKWIELIHRYTNAAELTADLLNALIEKVVVHEATKDADGSRMREVESCYRYIGRIE